MTQARVDQTPIVPIPMGTQSASARLGTFQPQTPSLAVIGSVSGILTAAPATSAGTTSAWSSLTHVTHHHVDPTLAAWLTVWATQFADVLLDSFPCQIQSLDASGNVREILIVLQASSARTTSVLKSQIPVTHPPVVQTQSAQSLALEIQSAGVFLTMFPSQTQSLGVAGSVKETLTVAGGTSARTTNVSPGLTRVTRHLADQIQNAMSTG